MTTTSTPAPMTGTQFCTCRRNTPADRFGCCVTCKLPKVQP